MKLIEAACIETDLPICVHLDHGDTFELSRLHRRRFSSVLSTVRTRYEENVKLTRQVVEYAHDHGVVVEASLAALKR
jgi:fructose-bisphosphate aldolase class II